jgi:fructosamine-3-kinase
MDLIPVSGGDINQCFKLITANEALFLKLNDKSAFPSMFEREAEGLNALRKATSLKVPSVVGVGETRDKQYLLLEWLEKAPPSTSLWKQLAAGLTQLHQSSTTWFGWQKDNYIGSLPQLNEWKETWASFYLQQRILPLAELLVKSRRFTTTEMAAIEALDKKLRDIFPPEPPSLLHGDLWAGNMMCVQDKDGVIKPAIYDPAVYYGHREMDLGMSLLFGGYDKKMYDEYNEIFPLEKDWRKRVSITQLYPLLVHAVLFGGGYIGQCRNILMQWK